MIQTQFIKNTFFSGIEVTLIIPMVHCKREKVSYFSQHHSDSCVSESISINVITKPLIIAG